MTKQLQKAFLLPTLFAAAVALPQTADASVAINATNFPDPEMQRWVKDYVDGSTGQQKDGILSDEEIATVQSVDFSTGAGWNVSNFKGIEYFTAITNFGLCDSESATTLDLTGLNALTEMHVDRNPNLVSVVLPKGCTSLSTISISANSKLASITWPDNVGNISVLNLSGNGSLLGFDLKPFTSLYELNIENCTAWGKTIDISGLHPKYVHFSNTGIENFIAHNNALWDWWGCSGQEYVKHLDISYDSKYEWLSLPKDWSGLESVNVSNSEKLTMLDIPQETMKSFTVDNCPKLVDLRIGHTQIREFDLAAVLPNLEALYLDRQEECAKAEWSWKRLDVSKLTHLRTLIVPYNQLTYLNLEENKEMTYESGIWEQYPDFQLVKLSENEVGIAVDDAFVGEKLTYLKTDETELTPKTTTIDGQQYIVVWNNAATAESLIDKTVYYHYTVGFVSDAERHLRANGTAKSVVKCPSFLKLSNTTVSGIYGGTVTAPAITCSQDYNGTLTYATSNPQVVTVAADGTLTIVGVGEATITITGVETEYRQAPAPVTYTVQIAQASPVFAFASATMEATCLDAVPTNALSKGVYDGQVVYTSSNTEVATVDANGKVTTKIGGTVTITASGEETANCNKPTSASYTLTVKKRETTITLSTDVANGTYGGTVEAPKATVTNGYDGQLTYTSGNEQVVKVAADGELTIIGAGEATVTVSAAATSVYNSAVQTFKVVIAKGQPVFSFDKTSVTAHEGETLEKNELTKGFYDGEVVYTSDDATIAEVDATTGIVTAKKMGIVTITATGAETNNCLETAASYKVTVKVRDRCDVNGDGIVDVADIATIILRIAELAKSQQGAE